jgi:hypothetical protein
MPSSGYLVQGGLGLSDLDFRSDFDLALERYATEIPYFLAMAVVALAFCKVSNDLSTCQVTMSPDCICVLRVLA